MVVGGAGFLGSHLVDHLINDRHCNVLVIDNLVAGKLEYVNKKAHFEHYDITGSETYLHRLFKRFQAEYVFNHAAEPYIPVSFERPIHVFNVNAFGALKVINAAQEAGVTGILQVSSAEIYGEQYAGGPHHGGKIAENAPVIPHSSYGAAKAAIDSMVQVRWKEAKTPVISLRQFNCIGERETHPYVVPEIISQLSQLDDKALGAPTKELNDMLRQAITPFVRLGNNSTRDFQYAGDAVRFATQLLEHGEFGEVYNMGSESCVKIYDLAETIGELMGFRSVEVRHDPSRDRPWEIWHLQSDNTKLYNAIGYSRGYPTILPLEESLERTIRWYEQMNSRWPWEEKELERGTVSTA